MPKALGTSPALNFPEAGQHETGVLMYAAVGLMVITLVVNILGQSF